MGRLQQLIAEVRRRRVIRALVGWGVFSFAILQIYEPVMHGLHLPEWTLTLVVVGLGLGFPVTTALAWVYDLTASGVTRTPLEPGATVRGARLALVLATLGLLAAVPGLLYLLVWPGVARRSAAALTVAPPAAPSIAVLPFADLSPGHDQDYLSDGVAEEILDALAAIDGLHVAGRTSSFSFKGRSAGLDEIASALHVGYVLDGSVRREDQRVRVTARLVDARTGYNVWSRTFDRELSGILALQDEIGRAVATALEVKLLPREGADGAARRVTSPEAYGEYLLGRQLFNRGAPETYAGAVTHLERAAELDDRYAPTWSSLAAALFGLADSGDLAPHEMEALEQRALAATDKAMALGPGLAEVWSVRGWLRMRIAWDWAGARDDLEHALALSPGDAPTHLRQGALLLALGRFAEAAAVERQAIALDPLDANAWAFLADAELNAGRRDLARQALERALELSPGSIFPNREMIFLDLLDARPAEALRRSEQATVAWSRLSGTALAEHALGHPEASQAALDALVTGYAHIAALQIAEVYAWRHQPDRAFEWLERALAQRDSGMARLKQRPGLIPIRGDPRFAALLARMKLPVE